MTIVYVLRGFTVVQHDTSYTLYYGEREEGRFSSREDVEEKISSLLGRGYV